MKCTSEDFERLGGFKTRKGGLNHFNAMADVFSELSHTHFIVSTLVTLFNYILMHLAFFCFCFTSFGEAHEELKEKSETNNSQ